MERTSNNTENNMTNKIIEVVNHIDNTTYTENNVQVNYEEVNHIDNTTN